ncbi:hypothetical protein ACSS6W_009842 [Trichoderma asperelloides]
MCQYSYIHYHHQYPCTHPSSLVPRYSYCSEAALNPATNHYSPCAATTVLPSPEATGENPCERGSCLISPACSSGTCRLQDLNGRWICCKCKRSGNIYRTCQQRKRGCPDTFCYHDICESCTPDV